MPAKNFTKIKFFMNRLNSIIDPIGRSIFIRKRSLFLCLFDRIIQIKSLIFKQLSNLDSKLKNKLK
jgi:hypothetical protein